MHRVILHGDHLTEVLAPALAECRHRLFIATADVKDVHLPQPGSRQARSIVDVFHDLSARDIEIELLHAGVPSTPFLERLKQRIPANLVMRRCPRVHAKAVIVDARWMYLGSANLTGAGLGAKGPHRRNFEVGLWTDELDLIDPVLESLSDVFHGTACNDCDRRDHCPIPLEEPEL